VPPDIFGHSPPVFPTTPIPQYVLPPPGFVPRVVGALIELNIWLRSLNHLQWEPYKQKPSVYPPPVFEAQAQGLQVRISFTGNTHEPDTYHTQAPVRVPYPSLDKHWTTLVDHCKENDEEMFKNWDEEINALLVFVSRGLPGVTRHCL
jgi:hypothetical protein